MIKSVLFTFHYWVTYIVVVVKHVDYGNMLQPQCNNSSGTKENWDREEYSWKEFEHFGFQIYSRFHREIEQCKLFRCFFLWFEDTTWSTSRCIFCLSFSSLSSKILLYFLFSFYSLVFFSLLSLLFCLL